MRDGAPGRALCLEIVRREIAALGFAGQPYAVAFQIDRTTGELHVHAAVSRIARRPGGQLFAIDPGLYKNRLKEIPRACERDYGLTVVSSDRQPGDRARAAGREEFEESRRLETDVRAIRNAILDCFETSDSGRAFKAALDARGFELATGDRRDCFVVVDHAGGHHALTKKLTGLTLAQIRIRLSDLDRAQLLSVDQAKARQRARQVENATAIAPKPARDFFRTAARATEPAREAPEAPKHGRAADCTRRGDTCTTGPAACHAAAKKSAGVGAVPACPRADVLAQDAAAHAAPATIRHAEPSAAGCRYVMAFCARTSCAARSCEKQPAWLIPREFFLTTHDQQRDG